LEAGASLVVVALENCVFELGPNPAFKSTATDPPVEAGLGFPRLVVLAFTKKFSALQPDTLPKFIFHHVYPVAIVGPSVIVPVVPACTVVIILELSALLALERTFNILVACILSPIEKAGGGVCAPAVETKINKKNSMTREKRLIIFCIVKVDLS
jgi:hypothetical protein